MRRLLLWDIDGTLIHGGGVGRRAINEAARAIAALVDVPVVDMHGKTDPQILREIFAAADVELHLLDAHVADAVRAAEANLLATEAELRARGGTHPGVVEVLERLHRTDGVRQTLLTGNIVANSAIKLAAFDLTHLFDHEIGAYGTDHEDRLELVPIALERVERLRGERYDPDDVWVIGDTAGDRRSRHLAPHQRGPALPRTPIAAPTAAAARSCRPPASAPRPPRRRAAWRSSTTPA